MLYWTLRYIFCREGIKIQSTDWHFGRPPGWPIYMCIWYVLVMKVLLMWRFCDTWLNCPFIFISTRCSPSVQYWILMLHVKQGGCYSCSPQSKKNDIRKKVLSRCHLSFGMTPTLLFRFVLLHFHFYYYLFLIHLFIWFFFKFCFL